jgi:hypothetical protein
VKGHSGQTSSYSPNEILVDDDLDAAEVDRLIRSFLDKDPVSTDIGLSDAEKLEMNQLTRHYSATENDFEALTHPPASDLPLDVIFKLSTSDANDHPGALANTNFQQQTSSSDLNVLNEPRDLQSNFKSNDFPSMEQFDFDLKRIKQEFVRDLEQLTSAPATTSWEQQNHMNQTSATPFIHTGNPAQASSINFSKHSGVVQEIVLQQEEIEPPSFLQGRISYSQDLLDKEFETLFNRPIPIALPVPETKSFAFTDPKRSQSFVTESGRHAIQQFSASSGAHESEPDNVLPHPNDVDMCVSVLVRDIAATAELGRVKQADAAVKPVHEYRSQISPSLSTQPTLTSLDRQQSVISAPVQPASPTIRPLATADTSMEESEPCAFDRSLGQEEILCSEDASHRPLVVGDLTVADERIPVEVDIHKTITGVPENKEGRGTCIIADDFSFMYLIMPD